MRTLWSDWADWAEIERPYSVLDELRRQMDRVWSEYSVGRADRPAASLSSEIVDEGTHLKLTAVLPGLTEKDVKLQANRDGLTLEVERQLEVPDGYGVHRRERPSGRVARSWAFPCHVDVEKVVAKLTDGILTVELPKVPEAQPRQITVRAG